MIMTATQPHVCAHRTERTSRTTGKGRGQRTFYGFELTATVTCSCGKLGDGFGVQVVLSEDIQASSMEEC